MTFDPASLDQDIREARGEKVRAALDAWYEKGVSRSDAAAFANLAWRADLAELGLRVLHPIVRPPPTRPKSATDAEKLEYAQCLVQSGALLEGHQLLLDVDEKKAPKALLYRAGVHVAEWDYESSIPLLTKYVGATGVGAYEKLVGKVNLAAALLVTDEQPVKAKALLSGLLHSSSLRRYSLMLGRVLELAAESAIRRRRWAEARGYLAEAEKKLKGWAGFDAFLVRKFQAFIEYRENEGGAGKQRLLEVREEAIQRRHWETVRHCDSLRATGERDFALFRHVYFGTPWEAYRKKLLAEYGEVSPDDLREHCWNPMGWSPATNVLDFFEGTYAGKRILKPGMLMHRLMAALSADFYRPARLPTLFARAYPDSYFNPVTSPAQIYDAMARLRRVFTDERLPFVIEETGGTFRLSASAPIALRLRLDPPTFSHSVEVERLYRRWKEAPFSMSEAASCLEMPVRSTTRVLLAAMGAGAVLRVGRGPATRYHFPPRRKG